MNFEHKALQILEIHPSNMNFFLSKLKTLQILNNNLSKFQVTNVI